MTYLPTDEPATKSDIHEVKSDLRELKSEVRESETRLSQRIDGIETRLNHYDVRFDNIHEAMRQHTRSFILATTGMMVTLSAVAFGGAALI